MMTMEQLQTYAKNAWLVQPMGVDLGGDTEAARFSTSVLDDRHALLMGLLVVAHGAFKERRDVALFVRLGRQLVAPRVVSEASFERWLITHPLANQRYLPMTPGQPWRAAHFELLFEDSKEQDKVLWGGPEQSMTPSIRHCTASSPRVVAWLEFTNPAFVQDPEMDEDGEVVVSEEVMEMHGVEDDFVGNRLSLNEILSASSFCADNYANQAKKLGRSMRHGDVVELGGEDYRGLSTYVAYGDPQDLALIKTTSEYGYTLPMELHDFPTKGGGKKKKRLSGYRALNELPFQPSAISQLLYPEPGFENDLCKGFVFHCPYDDDPETVVDVTNHPLIHQFQREYALALIAGGMQPSAAAIEAKQDGCEDEAEATQSSEEDESGEEDEDSDDDDGLESDSSASETGTSRRKRNRKQ